VPRRYTYRRSSGRATVCSTRSCARAGALPSSASPGSWRSVYRRAASARSQTDGPDAVAFYGSGQLLTEEYYVAVKLAKGFLGTNNFDTNSRLLHGLGRHRLHAVVRRRRAARVYDDLERADCFFLIGTNTADCHPIVWKRIRRRSSPKLAAPYAS